MRCKATPSAHTVLDSWRPLTYLRHFSAIGKVVVFAKVVLATLLVCWLQALSLCSATKTRSVPHATCHMPFPFVWRYALPAYWCCKEWHGVALLGVCSLLAGTGKLYFFWSAEKYEKHLRRAATNFAATNVAQRSQCCVMHRQGVRKRHI